MRGSVAAGSSSGSARHRKLSVPAPTYWGTKDCKHWPQFHLQDYQPESNEDYLESYGLGDILPLADVTIVGLYFADSAECRTQAIAAGQSNGTERCNTFKDDDNPTPINYDDVWQYYYYSEEDDDDNSSAKKKSDDDDADDDKSSKKKKSDDDDDDDDDEDDKDATATSAEDAASAAATDDGWRPGLHNAGDDDADDDDVFWSGKHSKKTYKGYGTEKSKGIPSYVTASLIAVLAFAISAGIFWLRRRYYQENGTVGSTYGYGKLPMADGSGVVADTQLEVEMRAPGVGTASPARGSKDDGSYGSL